jgi:hypothetical protein
LFGILLIIDVTHGLTMGVYDEMRERRKTMFAHAKYGDPAASSAAILPVVDAENPPLRLRRRVEQVEQAKKNAG